MKLFGKIHYRKNPLLRLFCFHFAGGGASYFRDWHQLLPDHVEVWPVQLPGRETRIVEPAYTSYDHLIPDLAAALTPFFKPPFAFFGHSMGAITAFELAHYLAGRQIPLQALIVSGRISPRFRKSGPDYHSLPDHEFLQKIQNMGGTAKEVLEHKELVDLLLPIFRADFTMSEKYRYRERGPLAVPLAAYAGRDDDLYEPDHHEAWAQESCGTFRSRIFEGGHFFIGERSEEVLGCLAEDLQQYCPQLKG